MVKIKIFLITFLIIGFTINKQNLKAQVVDKNFIDSVSYVYYLAQNWENLENFGIKASKHKFDFYYLNVRTGIASFNLENYYTAEKFFKKAIKNYSDDFAKEYLFWTYYNLGDKFSANDVYKKLPEATKYTINYKNRKLLDFAYLEVGRKFSDQPDSVISNVNYLNVGLNHYLTSNIKMYEAYTYLAQNQSWGNYVQQQAYLNLTFNLHHKTKLDLAVHLSDYKSNILINTDLAYYSTNTLYTNNGIYTVDTTITGTSLISGTYQQQMAVAYVGLTKKIGRVKLIASLHFSIENNIPNITTSYSEHQLIYTASGIYPIYYQNLDYNSNTTNNITYRKNIIQPGLQISYFPKILKDGLEVGIKFYSIIDSAKYFLPMPFINLEIKDKYFINTDFMKKGVYPFADNAASSLFNNYNDMKTRYSFTAGYKLTKEVSFYATYIYEDIYDNILLTNYKLNSALLGIKINF